ncbi:MAG TPA: TfoX/Sxy family protein [Micrococcaceae bacterium]
MQIPKPSESDKERFRILVQDLPGTDIKPMFGNLGAFVNGNMFAGLFGPTLGLRLSDADRAALQATAQTVPFGPADRPMGGYVGFPEAWLGDPDRARDWVAKAHAHVAELPPKRPGQRNAKQKGTRA